MATRNDFHKLIIGRSERLDFLDLSIHGVPAKVDTGAYRSAVHASDITEKDGVVSFTLFWQSSCMRGNGATSFNRSIPESSCG